MTDQVPSLHQNLERLQIRAPANGEETPTMETCAICREDTRASEIHAIESCAHRFCVSCVAAHARRKLLDGALPACPQDGCATKLTVEGSGRFLSPELRRVMAERVREARIPPGKRVYCPDPKCSALMSVAELTTTTARGGLANRAGAGGRRCECCSRGADVRLRKQCVRCGGAFCVGCRVPWHDGVSCASDRLRRASLKDGQYRLEDLARRRSWCQCARCKHMVERVTGCNMMTCLCGEKFCYKCGREWNKCNYGVCTRTGPAPTRYNGQLHARPHWVP